jgi:hypothetical protein
LRARLENPNKKASTASLQFFPERPQKNGWAGVCYDVISKERQTFKSDMKLKISINKMKAQPGVELKL